jgi:hypothetical protein
MIILDGSIGDYYYLYGLQYRKTGKLCHAGHFLPNQN